MDLGNIRMFCDDKLQFCLAMVNLRIVMQEEEPQPDPTSQPRSQEQEEELRELRRQLVNLFREQMELR